MDSTRLESRRRQWYSKRECVSSDSLYVKLCVQYLYVVCTLLWGTLGGAGGTAQGEAVRRELVKSYVRCARMWWWPEVRSFGKWGSTLLSGSCCCMRDQREHGTPSATPGLHNDTCESEPQSDTKSAGVLVLDFPDSQNYKQSMSFIYKVPQPRYLF